MKSKLAATAVALGLLAAGPALAKNTTILVAPCTLSVGGSCLFAGNITLKATGNNSLGAADDAYNTQTPNPTPALDLAGLTYQVDQTTGFAKGQTSGTVTAPFLVSYYAVKGGDFFDLFEITPSTTFSWSTSGITVGRGQHPAISHLVYFGSSVPTGTPEPATWAMMLAGLFGIGAMMRRRTAKLATA